MAIGRNIVWMHDGAQYWAGQSSNDRRTFELVAGSEARNEVPPDRAMSEFSPDVKVGDLDELVADGAITPKVPTTPEELAIVAKALGLSPP